MTAGNGKLNLSGFGSNTQVKEAIKVGFDYYKGNISRVSGSAKDRTRTHRFPPSDINSSLSVAFRCSKVSG